MTATTTDAPVTFHEIDVTDVHLRTEQRLAPDRPATVNDYLDGIWRNEFLGFGEAHYVTALRNDKKMLDDVRANRIRPQRVVGRGVLKPKTTAIAYLEGSIRASERALATRGRSAGINISNAEGYARDGHAHPGYVTGTTLPNPIEPDPAAEAAALAYWHDADRHDGGTYDHERGRRTVIVCGRCIDYADEAAVVWWDKRRGEFIHRGNDENRCPGQEDDDTADACTREDVERVEPDLWSHASLDHWQRHGQYLPARAVGLNGFEVTAVRFTDEGTYWCGEDDAEQWGVYVTYDNEPSMHVADKPTREEADQMATKLAARFAVEWRNITPDTASSSSRQHHIETGRYMTISEVREQEDADVADAREKRAAEIQARDGMIGMSDQPTTCGKCGRRTEYEDLADSAEGETRQLHVCVCGHEFVVESDREWDEHDENHDEHHVSSGCSYCPSAQADPLDQLRAVVSDDYEGDVLAALIERAGLAVSG